MKAEINWMIPDIMMKTSNSYGDEEQSVYYQSPHFFDEQIKMINVDESGVDAGISELNHILTISLDLIKNKIKSTTLFYLFIFSCQMNLSSPKHMLSVMKK